MPDIPVLQGLIVGEGEKRKRTNRVGKDPQRGMGGRGLTWVFRMSGEEEWGLTWVFRMSGEEGVGVDMGV